MKGMQMNKLIRLVLSIIIVLASMNIYTTDCYAESYKEYILMLDKALPDSAGFVDSVYNSLESGGYSKLAQDLIDGSGRFNAQCIRISVDNGYMLEYVDKFKESGKLDANWQPPASTKSSGENTATQPKPKTEYTVEDVESYTAWTTKNCNIRSGADTTYDKVGSLKKFEEVKVTGKASTGWCRITTSSGAEAYISNSLLTTEDPKTVTVQTSEKSDEVVTTVEGEKPSTAAQVVDEIKAEEASEEPKEEPKEEELTYTSEITKETTCTEKGIITYTSENGDSYTEEIPMLEHVPGDWEVSKEPSLTKDGEKVKKCTVCGEILETQKIPAKTNVLIGLIIACVVAIGGCIAGVVLYKKQKKD
jgi:uncharacterized protein YgiM (DUF1202 family)